MLCAIPWRSMISMQHREDDVYPIAIAVIKPECTFVFGLAHFTLEC